MADGGRAFRWRCRSSFQITIWSHRWREHYGLGAFELSIKSFGPTSPRSDKPILPAGRTRFAFRLALLPFRVKRLGFPSGPESACQRIASGTPRRARRTAGEQSHSILRLVAKEQLSHTTRLLDRGTCTLTLPKPLLEHKLRDITTLGLAQIRLNSASTVSPHSGSAFVFTPHFIWSHRGILSPPQPTESDICHCQGALHCESLVNAFVTRHNHWLSTGRTADKTRTARKHLRV